jgi:hypothetical protein
LPSLLVIVFGLTTRISSSAAFSRPTAQIATEKKGIKREAFGRLTTKLF